MENKNTSNANTKQKHKHDFKLVYKINFIVDKHPRLYKNIFHCTEHEQINDPSINRYEFSNFST